MKVVRDSEGVDVREGDIIHFSYGIPPVGVSATVIRRGNKLIAITKGHNPPECPVTAIEGHVGCFWVEQIRSPGSTQAQRQIEERSDADFPQAEQQPDTQVEIPT